MLLLVVTYRRLETMAFERQIDRINMDGQDSQDDL